MNNLFKVMVFVLFVAILSSGIFADSITLVATGFNSDGLGIAMPPIPLAPVMFSAEIDRVTVLSRSGKSVNPDLIKLLFVLHPDIRMHRQTKAGIDLFRNL